MPRSLRILYPDVPVHVVQRGHNREACFFADEDYACYLSLLREGLRKKGVALHAYVLMTNHVHLLLTPSSGGGIPQAMISLGSRYVRYVNRKYGRAGTLWDGRYRASIVQTARYLLACQRYIELNPVRAGMVTNPADYRWGSYRSHAFCVEETIVEFNGAYLALGDTFEKRRSVYRQICETPFDDVLLARMRSSFERGKPLGDVEFLNAVENA